MKTSKRSVGKRKTRGRGRRPKQNSYNKGHWSDEEKRLFLVGLRKYGKGCWKQIGRVVTTRSHLQIKSYAQKMLKKQDVSKYSSDDLDPAEGVSRELDEAKQEEETGEEQEVVPCEQDDDPPVGLKLCDSTSPTTSGCHLARPVPRSPLGGKHLGALQDDFPSRALFDLRLGSTDQNVFSSVATQYKASLLFQHTNQDDLVAAMALCELAFAGGDSTTKPPSFARATSSAFCTVPDSTFQPVDSVEEMEVDVEEMEEDRDMLPFLVTRKDGCQEQKASVVTPTDFA